MTIIETNYSILLYSIFFANILTAETLQTLRDETMFAVWLLLLSVSESLPAYLCAYHSIFLSVCLSLCLSHSCFGVLLHPVSMSLLSVVLSLLVCVCVCLCLSVSVSVSVSLCLSVCPPVCMCLTVCVCLSLSV